ncbi:uncharacterized protein Triagg1_6397 [Trichoderma aggressivum f. europaeum]|uniref:Uncharacterized protein n=1 Tax=Trichoderma aggressivum f. europaeum TaxID=173218 RepID=A0AAE1J492_9HYPO|nr:hypothetical protein Triagg1_6397 [Trichoderma aggressivum f. europaeum]
MLLQILLLHLLFFLGSPPRSFLAYNLLWTVLFRVVLPLFTGAFLPLAILMAILLSLYVQLLVTVNLLGLLLVHIFRFHIPANNVYILILFCLRVRALHQLFPRPTALPAMAPNTPPAPDPRPSGTPPPPVSKPDGTPPATDSPPRTKAREKPSNEQTCLTYWKCCACGQPGIFGDRVKSCVKDGCEHDQCKRCTFYNSYDDEGFKEKGRFPWSRKSPPISPAKYLGWGGIIS